MGGECITHAAFSLGPSLKDRVTLLSLILGFRLRLSNSEYGVRKIDDPLQKLHFLDLTFFTSQEKYIRCDSALWNSSSKRVVSYPHLSLQRSVLCTNL